SYCRSFFISYSRLATKQKHHIKWGRNCQTVGARLAVPIVIVSLVTTQIFQFRIDDFEEGRDNPAPTPE
ncbi:MAG: hypothetical protein L6428_13620, partial [Candidatus Aminicenantes bacterium]|nr:hypothetical protein [Candidatus Aminicenantes bacterium]